MIGENKLSALKINYAAFLRRLPELLAAHEGQYALMRDGDIIEYFDSPRAALLAGRGRYPDDLFSVQEVRRSEADFGWFSRVATDPEI
jgi:hypothetical protein